MKKYDIFISYRRSAYNSANLIATRLKAAGYRVFFDLESMRSGKFNIQLYDIIDNCKDFIIVLSPNALDRCVNEEDWVRKEITHAILKGKNIVPIMLNGFVWPKDMPTGMEDLPMYQGIASSPDFFDLAMERLNTYLTSYKHTKQRTFIKWTIATAVCIAILFSSLFFILRSYAKPLCKEVTDHLTLQICALDLLLEDNKMLLKAWEDVDSNDKEEVNEVITVAQKNIKEYKNAINSNLELTSWQNFLISLYGTSATAISKMEKSTEMIFDDAERNMNLMQNIASNKHVRPSNKEFMQRTLSILDHSCASHFYAYLQILNEFPEPALEGYNEMVSRWMNMPDAGLGYKSSEYSNFVKQKSNIIQEELAKINKINLNLQDKVYEQEQRLDSLNNAALAEYRKRVATITINPNDDLHTNWERIIIFAYMLETTISFHNEAVNTGEDPGVITPTLVFEDLNKMLDDFMQQYPSAKYAAIAKAFYSMVFKGAPLVGVMVTEFAEGTTHDTYKAGDIVIEWNSNKIKTLSQLREAYRKSANGKQKILRLEKGEFKEVIIPIPYNVDNVMFKNLIKE